jgi:hypothetical protein
MSEEQTPKDVRSALEKAGLSVIGHAETQGGVLHELDPAGSEGRRSLVFDDGTRGMTVAIRVNIPEGSSLAKAPAGSEAALCFLGALTYSIQGRQAEAKLILGSHGVEGILVSRHICAGALAVEKIPQELHDLRQIAGEIDSALAAPGPELIARLLANLSVVTSELARPIPKEEARIVPTFDEEARDRMMQGGQ